MAILGTFLPTVAHGLINDDTSKNSNLISATTTPTTFDKFGVKKIYPTKQDGREWFINMDNPNHDSTFSFENNQIITKQSDGSWNIASPKVRLHVTTPPNAQPWKNVEITGYAKIDSIITDGKTDLAWLARSGKHNDNVPCDGTALIGGIHDDGTVGWKKEIWFTGGYTKELAQAKPTDSILGRWIGWKVVMYNTDNDRAVRMESYLDDNNNNHWVKVTDIIDDGGWYADASDNEFYSADCGKLKDHIITNSGPTVTFRSDNIVWDLKDLSVREIQGF